MAEQIELHMRELIISNRLAAGELLPAIDEMAASFEVSRTIVREAMKSLQAKGMVEIANGKRARVLPLSDAVLVDFFGRFSQSDVDSLLELMELRRGIEVQSAVLAAQRRDDADLAELKLITAEMQGTIGDPERFLDTDVEFHLQVARAARNQVVLHFVSSIRTVVRDTMWNGLSPRTDPPAWREIISTHVKLCDAIDRRDADTARDLMAYHFDEAIRVMRLQRQR